MAHLSIIDGITPQGLLEGLVHVPQGLAQDGSRLFPDKSSSPDLLRCDVGPNFLSIVVPAFSALFNTFLSAEILHFPLCPKRWSRLSDVTLHEAVHGVKAPRHLRHQKVDPRPLSRRLMAKYGIFASSFTHTHTYI
jgi:hypothetical protein